VKTVDTDGRHVLLTNANGKREPISYDHLVVATVSRLFLPVMALPNQVRHRSARRPAEAL
jgi:NADPH-dependent 2,4-dienoyl-CoA reductase/sulfur reductase-like enzyme